MKRLKQHRLIIIPGNYQWRNALRRRVPAYLDTRLDFTGLCLEEDAHVT